MGLRRQAVGSTRNAVAFVGLAAIAGLLLTPKSGAAQNYPTYFQRQAGSIRSMSSAFTALGHPTLPPDYPNEDSDYADITGDWSATTGVMAAITIGGVGDAEAVTTSDTEFNPDNNPAFGFAHGSTHYSRLETYDAFSSGQSDSENWLELEGTALVTSPDKPTGTVVPGLLDVEFTWGTSGGGDYEWFRTVNLYATPAWFTLEAYDSGGYVSYVPADTNEEVYEYVDFAGDTGTRGWLINADVTVGDTVWMNHILDGIHLYGNPDTLVDGHFTSRCHIEVFD